MSFTDWLDLLVFFFKLGLVFVGLTVIVFAIAAVQILFFEDVE